MGLVFPAIYSNDIGQDNAFALGTRLQLGWSSDQMKEDPGVNSW